jgi:hypothetical protein
MGRLGSFTFEFLGVDVGFQQASSKVLQAMRHIGQTAEEMSSKLRLGTASTQDLFEEIVKGIPGIGEIFTFGRGIRELVTGEKAYVEVLKQQNEEQLKRIDLTNKATDAHQKLQQELRTQAQGVERGRAGSNFGAAFGAILGNEDDTKANADRVRRTIRETFKAQLDEIEKQKGELADKIRNTEQPDTFLFGKASPFKVDQGKVNDLRTQFKALEKVADQLRKDIGGKEDFELIKGGNKAFVDLGKIVGGQVVKGFDAAAGAVQRYLSKAPELDAFTKSLIAHNDALESARGGGIGQFNLEQAGLKEASKQGLIGTDVLNKLTDKSKFDQVARSVGSIVQQYAPIVEMIGRLIDSNFGISGFAQRATSAITGVFPGRIDTSTSHDFKSTTLGLSDLGRRIQEGAASGNKGAAATEKYLMNKNFGTVK